MKTITLNEHWEVVVLEENEKEGFDKGSTMADSFGWEDDGSLIPLSELTEEQAREIAPKYKFTSESVEWEWYGDEEFHVEYALHWVRWASEKALQKQGYAGLREGERPQHMAVLQQWRGQEWDNSVPPNKVVLKKK